MNLSPTIQYLRAWLGSRVADRDETGATAVEYGMLVALIAAILVAVIGLLGDEIFGAFADVVDALNGSGARPTKPA